MVTGTSCLQPQGSKVVSVQQVEGHQRPEASGVRRPQGPWGDTHQISISLLSWNEERHTPATWSGCMTPPAGGRPSAWPRSLCGSACRLLLPPGAPSRALRSRWPPTLTATSPWSCRWCQKCMIVCFGIALENKRLQCPSSCSTRLIAMFSSSPPFSLSSPSPYPRHERPWLLFFFYFFFLRLWTCTHTHLGAPPLFLIKLLITLQYWSSICNF